MSFALDANAIAIVLKRGRERAIGLLEGGLTLGLARYELGNVLWKEHVTKGRGLEGAAARAMDLARVFSAVRVEDIEAAEDFGEVMRLAIKLSLTFYDASYVYLARKHGVMLVTEDKELKEGARSVGVKAESVKEALGL